MFCPRRYYWAKCTKQQNRACLEVAFLHRKLPWTLFLDALGQPCSAKTQGHRHHQAWGCQHGSTWATTPTTASTKCWHPASFERPVPTRGVKAGSRAAHSPTMAAAPAACPIPLLLGDISGAPTCHCGGTASLSSTPLSAGLIKTNIHSYVTYDTKARLHPCNHELLSTLRIPYFHIHPPDSHIWGNRTALRRVLVSPKHRKQVATFTSQPPAHTYRVQSSPGFWATTKNLHGSEIFEKPDRKP